METAFSPYCKIEPQLVVSDDRRTGCASSGDRKKGHSLENSSKRDLKQVKQWAVTEKVHGANFAFVFDVRTGAMSFAKRNGLLSPSDRFFQYPAILPTILPIIQRLCEATVIHYHERCPSSDVHTVAVYGELFGGSYPATASEFAPVQRGVSYSPNLHFMAFDIKINDTEFLDFQDALALFRLCAATVTDDPLRVFLYAEPLALFPSYAAASEYPIGFDSTIPARLHCPMLPVGTNKAEGIVVRSMTRRFLAKKKIAEFAETDTAESYANNILSREEMQSLALRMMTTNRLHSAESKIGPLEDNQFAVFEELCADILRELRLDDSSDERHRDDRKAMRKFIMAAIYEKFSST